MSSKYTPTKWVARETVGTAEVMNNIEQGIVGVYDEIEKVNKDLESVNAFKNQFDNNLLSQNGYYRLPNGLLIQWGISEKITSGQKINFPTPFPSACFVAIAQMRGGALNTNLSTDTMVMHDKNAISVAHSYGSERDFNWFAIGI